MIRSIIFYIIVFPLLSITASCSNKGPVIEGRVQGIGNVMVYLHTFEGKNLKLIDSVFSKKDVFTFQMNPERKHGMYHVRWGNMGNDGIDLIYCNSDVRFSSVKDSLHTTVFEQSPDNDLFFSYYPISLTLEQLYRLGDRMFAENPAANRQKLIELSLYIDSLEFHVHEMLDQLDTSSHKLFAYSVVRTAFTPSFQYELAKNPLINRDEKVYMRDHFFKYTDFSEPGLTRTPFLHNNIEKYIQQYVIPYEKLQFQKACDFIISKASINDEMYDYVVNLLIRTFENSDFWEVYLYLMETYQTDICEDESAYQDQNRLYEIVKKSRPGNPASDITGISPDGKMITLHSQTKNNNAIVLLFWDPDCEHCKMIIDQLVTVWPAYRKKGLSVLTFSLTESKEEWLDAMKEHKMDSFINITDLKDTQSEVFDKYHIRGTPEIYVITGNYKIFSRPSNYIQLDNDLMQLLN